MKEQSQRNKITIDVHGETRETVKLLVKQFIDESHKLGYTNIYIVHGIGQRVLLKEVQKILKENKKVDYFKVNMFNEGETIVKLNS